MPRSEKQKEWALANKDKIREKNNDYQRANPEKRAVWSKKWYNEDFEKNPHKYMLKYAKNRAREKDLPFDLDLEWCINNTPTVCPIMGVELVFRGGDYAPSIDRKIPALGYTKENCWIISNKANKMKWDSTREELLAFCRGIIGLEEGGNLP